MRATHEPQQKVKKYIPALVLSIGVIVMLVVSWGLFGGVANVSQTQHSSFVYRSDSDVDLLLKHDDNARFWLHILDVAQYHNNKKTVLLQSPYKNFSTETVFQFNLDGNQKIQNINLLDINNLAFFGDATSQINVSQDDIYQKLDKLTDSQNLPNELQDTKTNKDNSDDATNITRKKFLTDGYGLDITIHYGDVENTIQIKNNDGSLHNILFYPLVHESEKLPSGYCDSFCQINMKSDKYAGKAISFAKDKPSYFFVTTSSQDLEDVVVGDSGDVPNELNLGSRFLKIVITPTDLNKKQYQLDVVEYKVLNDNQYNAHQIDVFIPHDTKPVERFLVPKEQMLVTFSQNIPEERRLFDELTQKGVVFVKDGQINQIDVLPKGQAECEQGATCIGDIELKNNDYQAQMGKLYQKAVGHSILSEIDRANQRFYVTGVVLEEPLAIKPENKSVGDSIGKPEEMLESVGLNNQHLNVSIDNVEYALRPLKGYLSEYIDGSHQTIYSLSQTAIHDLDKVDVLDKKIKFKVEMPPQKNQPVIFLTKLIKDGNHQYQDITLTVNGHRCDVIYADDINRKQNENDTQEADGATSQLDLRNHVFVQPLANRNFGFVHISHDNIAKCQNQNIATAAFEVELPIGICPAGQCNIFANDAKLNIQSRNQELIWRVNPRNFYQEKSKSFSTYPVKNVLLADGTPLAQDGKSTSAVRELGLLAFVGENGLFSHHLLGFSSQDSSFETITLSIRQDAQQKLQQAVNERLQDEKKGFVFPRENKNGLGNAQVIATIMNAKTGEILAAADSRQELLNNINLTGLETWDNGYPHTTKYLRWLPAYQNGGSHETTGSSVKLLTSLSILDYAISRQDKDMQKLITGGFTNADVGRFGYPVDFYAESYPSHFEKGDWHAVEAGGSMGRISLVDALQVSNNTYFAWLHEKITPALLYQPPNIDDESQGLLTTPILPRSLSQYAIANGKTVHKLGYDQPINLLTGRPEELSETIPAHSWYVSPMTLRVYTGAETHHILNHRSQVRRVGIGIGQIHLTPIHLASLSASISQGKTIYPRMTQVSEILPVYDEFDGKTDLLQTLSQSKIDGRPSLEYVIEGMRLAVTSGTATVLKNPKVCIYAKTGTAPIKSNKLKANNASITGFAYQPAENQQCSHQISSINQSDVISFACTVRYSASKGGASCGQLMASFFEKYFAQTQQGAQS